MMYESTESEGKACTYEIWDNARPGYPVATFDNIDEVVDYLFDEKKPSLVIVEKE